MNPRQLGPADLAEWADRHPRPVEFTAPGEVAEGIQPCPGLVLDGGEVAVAYELDEIELMHLARGGTLWLIVRGGLPVHGMFVSDPAARP